MILAIYVFRSDPIRLFLLELFSNVDISTFGFKMMEKRVRKTLTSLPERSAVRALDEEC